MPIDRTQLSALAHAGLPYWSPVSVAVLDGLLDALALAPGANVLDIGCGDGAMLEHVVERLQGTGTGVDRAPGALALARGRVGRLTWCSELPTVPSAGIGGPAPDLVIAVGSLDAEEAAGCAGGALLLGELVTLGTTAIEGLPAPGMNTPARHGWRLVATVVLQEAELRAYEAHWLGKVRAWAAAHPGEDLSDAIGAHEALWVAGGLGFELTAWRRHRAYIARHLEP